MCGESCLLDVTSRSYHCSQASCATVVLLLHENWEFTLGSEPAAALHDNRHLLLHYLSQQAVAEAALS